MFSPHQSVHGGLPTTTYGLVAPRMRITRSRFSGRSKSHETPPGPGPRSNAPAGSTPRRGRLSAMQ
eukprot:15434458-Alexandrium_andersonii.AAC.1